MGLISNKAYARELIFRPVTLTVLDVETKQPLEGITITVVNVVFYSKPLRFLFFPIDTTSGSVYHMYEYKTNENGIVEIPLFKYKVDRHHILYNQKIVINLELRDKSIDIDKQMRRFDFAAFHNSRDDFFFRLRPEYKAGEILCYIDPVDWEQADGTKPYITVILRKYKATENERDQISFFCDHEEFIFYLERFIEPEVSRN